jgi:tRNA(Ile)-lysidine synthase
MAGKPVKQQPLEQRVLGFIRDNRLTERGQTLLVAVSGGQDSACLLHLLHRLQPELGVKLHVAHLDHQLRGKESAADARYVTRLAKSLGIPATIAKRDAAAYQKEHSLSLEEAAREVRYNFLAETAAAVGTASVAVGHTLDDHVETILLHLVRGAGTRGLQGLRPMTKRRVSGKELKIVRPLLTVRRAETGEYCTGFQLQPRQDASNLSLEPLRNRVRLELLPLLQNYNSGIVEALQRTARIAGDDIAHLEKEAARFWPKVADKQGEVIALDKKALLKLPVSTRRYVLRMAVAELVGNLKDIEARHIEEMMQALDKPAGKQISLPYGLVFKVDYDRYLLSKGDISPLNAFPVLAGEYLIKIPGKTLIPGWRIEARVTEAAGLTTGVNSFSADFDYSRIGGKLTVRARQRSDLFQPLGMQGTKKVAQLMLDAKIPNGWRGRVPILADDAGILWVVGYRTAERVKITGQTKKVLHLKFERI